MAKWTVVGLDEQRGATFAHQVEADGPHDAIAKVATQQLEGSDDACIVGAIAGEVELVPPSDAGNVAYACDCVIEEGEGNE